MKNLLILFLLGTSSFALAQKEAYPALNFGEVDKGVYCHPPSQPFFEKKLRDSFHLSVGETELKEVMRDARNYQAREEIKGINRQLMSSNRVQRSYLQSQLVPKIESLIDETNRRNPIADFPVNGTASTLSSSEDGHLSLSMENLPKDDLEFLPPQIKEKLGSNVKIKYLYPYDKFDYVISYGGKELPMQKAFYKIQDDFEEACLRNALTGRSDRKKRETEIKNGSGGSSSQ